jgi:DNA-binding SARP family transcriptional activator
VLAVKPEATHDTAAKKTAPPIDGVWLAPPAPHRPRRTPGQHLTLLVRGLGSLAGLVALLVGLPAALVYGIGWPLPRSWQEIWAWLNGPTRITVRGIIDAGACVLWLMWAAIVVAVVVEIVAAVRRVRVPRLPLASPLQGLAAGLVGTAVIALTSTAARAAPPAQTAPAAAATNPRQPAALTPDTSSTSLPTSAAIRSQITLIAGGQHYSATVHPGDTLSAIARDWLGDPNRWPDIYELNRGRHFGDVGGTLTDPDLIYPGWMLHLPDDAVPPPGAVPAVPSAPPAATPPGAQPSNSAPSISDDDGLLTPRTPAPSPIRSVGPAATAAPDTSSATPAHTSAAEAPPSSDQRHNAGVELPNHGWVAAPVAAAIAAAAALVWIQRRRRYRPGSSTGSRRDDPDLTPLPHTIAVLQRARPDPAPDGDADDVPAEAMEALTVTQTALGANGDQLLQLSDVPAHGVGLVGPAAYDAARGVLAAVLSSGGPWAASEEATLITTTADLSTLLGPDAADQYKPARLHTFASITEALDDLERQLLHRARLASEQHDGDLSDDYDQPRLALPPIVLLTQAPTEPVATRLMAILAVGSRLGITGILLGGWTVGSTWHVNADGTIRVDGDTNAAPGRRLNILDTTAGSDILATLQQARQDDDDLPTPTPTQLPTRAKASDDGAAASGARSSAADASGRGLGPRSAAEDGPVRPADVRRVVSVHRLRLTVLGTPAIHLVDDQSSEEIRIRRTDGRQLLVYLAVNPDGVTSDQLMEALWPEVRPTYSRNRFHTTISELRQTLKGVLGADAITHVDDRYRLDVAHVDVDLWHLNAAAEQAATAVDPQAHIRALRDVVGLYTGDVADDYSWLWLAPYREATRRHVLDAYAQLADVETDPRAGLALVQDAIRIDPYGEDLYQRAMRLYAALNNADGVHRTFRAITERLAQLDIAVSSETQQTAADLLAQLEVRRRQSHLG